MVRAIIEYGNETAVVKIPTGSIPESMLEDSSASKMDGPWQPRRHYAMSLIAHKLHVASPADFAPELGRIFPISAAMSSSYERFWHQIRITEGSVRYPA